MFLNLLMNVERGHMIEDKLTQVKNTSVFMHSDGWGYEATMELEESDERLTIKSFYIQDGKIVYEKGEFNITMFIARDLFKKILEMFPIEGKSK